MSSRSTPGLVGWSPFAFGLIVTLASGALAADLARAGEVIQATLLALAPVPGPQDGVLTIQLEAITSEAALAADLDTFRKKGQDGLIERWQKENPVVARLLFPGELGVDVRVAREKTTADGRRHLTLVTDRPITFAEVNRRDRSREYPITWIELELDRDGNGQGQMIPLAKLELEDGELTFENQGNQAVRLTHLKVVR